MSLEVTSFSKITFPMFFLSCYLVELLLGRHFVDESLYDKNRLSVQPCISPTNPTRTMKTFLTCFTCWKVMAQCSV